jgi:hypothetical protein
VVNVRGGRGFGSDCGGNLARGRLGLQMGVPTPRGSHISFAAREEQVHEIM